MSLSTYEVFNFFNLQKHHNNVGHGFRHSFFYTGNDISVYDDRIHVFLTRLDTKTYFYCNYANMDEMIKDIRLDIIDSNTKHKLPTWLLEYHDEHFYYYRIKLSNSNSGIIHVNANKLEYITKSIDKLINTVNHNSINEHTKEFLYKDIKDFKLIPNLLILAKEHFSVSYEFQI